MTEEKFKFIKEVNYSFPDKNQHVQKESNLGKLIYCHFNNVKELTPNEEGKPFKNHTENQSKYTPLKRDQRCYFKENQLKIYSRGGSEYIVQTYLNVENVLPIENGFIIKTVHNKDMICFDAFENASGKILNKKLYSYFTLTNHPLDDLHPLSFSGQKDLLETYVDILFISYKIPVIVFYNQETKQLSFGLLKKRDETEKLQNLQGDEIEDIYINSIQPESRNNDLFNISKDYQLYIDEIFSLPALSPPDKILVQKGLTNSYEIILNLFFSQSKKLEVLSTDIRNIKNFKIVRSTENVQDISLINFSRQKYDQTDCIKVISKSLKEKLYPSNFTQDPQWFASNELKFIKKRLQYFSKDLIVLDTQSKCLIIYSGNYLIHYIEIVPSLDQQLPNPRQLFIPKNVKVDSLQHSHKSLITLGLNNNQQKRISLQFYITDSLILSIMKAFKTILPESLYESLLSDLMGILSNSNIEYQKYSGDVDQFTKFTNMLISIIVGEQTSTQSQSVILNQQTATQTQQQQQQTAKPAQALQTRILRSSTTNFVVDQQTGRKKLQTTQQQQQQVTQQQPQRVQQFRSSLTSTLMSQQKRIGSGSTELQPNQLFSSSASSSLPQISANPFADLLNSEFHKQIFGTQFKGLFNSEIKFQPQLSSISEQPQPQLLSSPTKSQPNKTSQPTVTQRSSIVNKQSSNISSHERKSSISQSLQYSFKTQKNDILPYVGNIFLVIHLLYEDLKLNKLRDSIESPKLLKLLNKIIFATEPLKKAAFLDYYIKENPQLMKEFESDIKKFFKGDSIIKEGVMIEPVPKIYKWLESCLRKSQSPLNYPYPLFFENSRKICRIYEILSEAKQNSQFSSLLNIQNNICIDMTTLKNALIKDQISSNDWLNSFSNKQDYLMQNRLGSLHLFEKILFCLKEENMSLDEIKKLPSIISLPIIEIIRYARLFQQEIQSIPKWPESLYKLIQREDILNNLRLFERSGISTGLKPQSHHALQFQKQGSKRFALTRRMTNVFSDENIDEIQLEQQRKQLENNILQTTADLIENKNDDNQNLREGAYGQNLAEYLKNRFSQDTRYKEVCSILNSSNEMIIKIENIKEYETLTEDKLYLEKQALLDKLFSRQLSKCVGRGALTFGSMQTIPTETLHIPKINQTGFVPQNETYMQVEYKDDQSKDVIQWPEFHNGVAAALKIAQSLKSRKGQSHTRNWIMYHKPNEPKYEHGGFLLAVGLLGQLDTLQPTDIYQHLKSTHDATAIGILLGRAASNIGTMDDHDTRTLCIHIPYLLPPSLSIDISLSIQSAAVIGAGLLYKGTSNRLMTEMLLAQIGRKPLSDKAIEREGYALASGIALGLVNLGIGSDMQGISDLNLNDRLIRFVEGGKIIDLPQSMLSANFNNDNTKCSSIKEGDMVNVHITSPGALLALALIHLKSNNEVISNKLLMPQTFYSLESVRPSFLLQKVLCKNLILWDSIQASKDWINSQIPPLIKDIYENDITTVEKRFSQQISEDEIDYSTVALCYVNIIAGAIFSIGFKYAGTGNKEVFTLIEEYTNFFRSLKIIQSNKETIGVVHSNFTKNQVDKVTVETCLCVASFAMSMVMAGTGDVDCFRILRVLRKRFEHDMHYGFNMAIHMSLGFLFLGSGAFTFSRNNLSIAALLCSLYPIFPATPNDNRYHLQALRHFYVLAIETRLLQARDVDSGEFVNLEINVKIENEIEEEKESVNVNTPAIINGNIKKIEVNSSEYHYICLQVQSKNDMMDIDSGLQNKKEKIFDQNSHQQIIYVKKRAYNEGNQDIILKSLKNTTQTNNLTSIFQNEQQSLKDLVSDSEQLLNKVSQIQDPSIQTFFKSFINLQKSHEYFEIEDIIFSQSRDTFNQLSVNEFFRLQDQYQAIRDLLNQNLMPENIKTKLTILSALYNSFIKDKLEATNILIDQIPNNKTITQKVLNENQLLVAYLEFIKNTIYIKVKQKEESIVKETQPLLRYQNYDKQQLIDNFRTLGEKSLLDNLNQDKLSIENMIDPHEIWIAQIITNQILNELIKQGETQNVEQYVQAKINGVKINEKIQSEINESIRQSLQQLFNHEQIDGKFIDEVLIQGLLNVGKY